MPGSQSPSEISRAKQSTVSVVIPSFNSPYIQETVQSVLQQTFQDFEIIIVDCSSDPALKQPIDNLSHKNVRIFNRHGQHLPGSNRNYGIEQTNSEFLICLDADDRIDPTFLEEALFVINCTDISMIGTSVSLFGEMNQKLKLYAHPTIQQLASGDAFVVTILIRRQLWEKLGGFRDHALGKEHIPEDWDFFLRALLDGDTLYNRGSYGFHYRKHYDSLTASPEMPSLEEMIRRMGERHQTALKERADWPQPTPQIRKDGWLKLVDCFAPGDARLLVLPEKINDEYIKGLDRLLSSPGDEAPLLIVLSTCQFETYGKELSDLLAKFKHITFSLPDFLEERELWLEFVKYLAKSRNIVETFFGQNFFFVDKLDEIKACLPESSFHYISRYSRAK